MNLQHGKSKIVYQETGTYKSAPRFGRPPKLTDADIRAIIRHVTIETRRQPFQEITEILNINVCN